MLRGPSRLAHTALACVCTTAFGRLVVPDVNMIPNGSIGSGARPGQLDGSANNEENDVCSCPACSAVAGSPLLSSVTAIHLSAGAASATIAANWGWVMAATAPVCSAK
jgi:hypothetical protein